MSFQISDKVLCVDDSVNPREPRLHPNGRVVKGEIYTVEGVVPNWNFTNAPGETGLFITGKPHINLSKDMPWPWGAHRFRRLEELKEEVRAQKSTLLPEWEETP